MHSISYKSAVITAFLILSLIAVGAVLFNSHTSTSAAILKLSSETVMALSERTVQRATNAVNTIETYLYVNAEIAAGSKDILANQDRLLGVFWQQLIHSQPVRTVYVADMEGNLVQVDQDPRLVTRVIDQSLSPAREQLTYRKADFTAIAHASRPVDYDPLTRSWFEAAEAGRVHWSEVYRFAFSEGQGDTRSQGVTASLAVTDPAGKRRYVVAVDVTLQGMSDFLSAQPISESVAIFVVDQQDRLVAYPYQLNLDPKYSTQDGPLPRVEALHQEWIQDAYANYKSSGSKTDEALITHTGGAAYITTVTSFEPAMKSTWRLVIIAPKSYLLSSANQILRESLVISLIILLISLFVIYWVAAYLSQPILQLAANSRLIEKFRFDEVTRPIRLRRHRWTEVDELDSSLRHIGTELQALAKYVPAELLAQWLQDDKTLEPGSTVKHLDLLFSGIDDPMQGSRTQTSAEIDAWLPRHFETLANTIHDQRGTIDRFTGDGVHALWGAPVAIEGGALRACSSALLCVNAALETSGDDRHHDGAPDSCAIQTNFAIHSGEAQVGNFGSQRRLSYTAVGLSVRSGAALLPLNRRYGTRIIISDATHERIEGRFQCRPLDVVRLFETGPTLTLYELAADQSTQLPLDRRLFIDAYTLAFEHYLRQDWGGALEQLTSIPEAYRHDPSLRLLASRCQGLLDGDLAPPPAAWDGAYPPMTPSPTPASIEAPASTESAQ